VVYGGWVKTEGVVRGKEVWETTRLGIDFRDGQRKTVGGLAGYGLQGYRNDRWTYYEKKYAVPAGTAQVHVDAGLGNCAGRAWFDDLSLKLIDAKGKPLSTVVVTEQVTDTSDWYAYKPPVKMSDAALDLSFLNDKPAGGHGFVTNKNGHFTFADGTASVFGARTWWVPAISRPMSRRTGWRKGWPSWG